MTAGLVKFFWVLTVQRPGLPAVTKAGTVTLPPRALRVEAFGTAAAETRRQAGIPAGDPVAVLFFYLEPEALP